MKLQETLDKEQENWIRDRGILQNGEQILEYGKAGEGNMNVVIRVKTNLKSFILKQSRSFVNKYPHIPAPEERILTEKAFYEAISFNNTLARNSPKMLDFCEESFIMVLDDLGNTADFTAIYKERELFTSQDAENLISYLTSLHGIEISNFPDNSAMKALNHEHIFVYPFLEENGFDLNAVQPGLQETALWYKKAENLKKEIRKLGERYLEKGNHLLHGDFYPGSWMRGSDSIKVIDTEFAFLGDKEFDLGVMIAHLKLAKISPKMIEETKYLYLQSNKIDQKLLNQFTGIEMLRRLIGLAQLPLHLSLKEKQRLCTEASSMIL
jgi:5-methylthioribose kinase